MQCSPLAAGLSTSSHTCNPIKILSISGLTRSRPQRQFSTSNILSGPGFTFIPNQICCLCVAYEKSLHHRWPWNKADNGRFKGGRCI